MGSLRASRGYQGATREKVAELLKDVLLRLESLMEDALANVEETRRDAPRSSAPIRCGTLRVGGDRGYAGVLKAEREGLPVEHSRAVLADDVEEELRVKERFAEVEEMIEDL